MIFLSLDHNPRHVTRYKTDLKPVQHVFKDWKEDGTEIIGQIQKHDWQKMVIEKLIEEEEQCKKIKNELLANLYMLKEIYNYL